ncbi:MAG TPA: right-handed parallel beta-helix repeat-containing protein [Acetobacteraceae bacterium]|nr:right-handed parallel beta-helix repeat-containing protein [Acetobacteraceae bacterium]
MKVTLAAAALVALAAPAAHASKIYVGTCNLKANHVATISEAIIAIGNNGTIAICPGTYSEQLTITRNMKLEGVTDKINATGAIITPPSGGLVANDTRLDGSTPVAAQIAVDNATVSISNVTVEGAGNLLGGCGPDDLIGIYFKNSSGAVQSSVVRDQYLVPFNQLGGCQTGLGIFAENNTGSSNVTVTGNVVEAFQKNGITGHDAGTVMTVTGNTVLGVGPTPYIAQNGIEIAYGATGTVTANTVGDVIYTGGDAASSGILIYGSAHVTATKNTVFSTQLAIPVVGDAVTVGDGDDATITSNVIGGTQQWDAIDICGASSATVTGNVVNGADESAVHLDSECGPPSTGDTVTGNKINGTCAGVLIGTGSGGATTSNSYMNVVNDILSGSDVCPAGGGGMRHPGRHGKLRVSPVR